MSSATIDKTRLYVGIVVVVAAVVLLQADWVAPSDHRSFWNVVLPFAILAFLAEAFAVPMWHGTRSTVSYVPYLAAIIMVGPTWAAAIGASVKLCSDSLFWRKPPIRVLHNSAVQVIATAVSGRVYLLFGGEFSIDRFAASDPRIVLAFGLAVVVYFLISNGAAATAISLSGGGDLMTTWRDIVWKEFAANVLSASLALLLAFLYIELELLGFLLVVLPLVFLRHAHSVNYTLEQINRDLLDLMVKSIEARDPYTSGHSQRVARMAKELARGMGVHSREVEQIETAALLHDVGKIYEEYAPVLRKDGRLTPDERDLMRTHPIRSADLVSTISTLRGYVVRCIRSHHENWDGSGYPDGLAGDEIPLGARIIMVADTADAMTTDRPYRGALSYDQLVAELERFSGKQFDPEIVTRFKKSTIIRRMVHDRGPPLPSASGSRVEADAYMTT